EVEVVSKAPPRTSQTVSVPRPPPPYRPPPPELVVLHESSHSATLPLMSKRPGTPPTHAGLLPTSTGPFFAPLSLHVPCTYVPPYGYPAPAEPSQAIDHRPVTLPTSPVGSKPLPCPPPQSALPA